MGEKKFITLGRQLCRRFCAVSLFFFFILFIFFVNAALAQAADRYWVGGTGDWSDAENHWATESGGAPNAINLPTELDSVFIDPSSGFDGGGIITIDVDTSMNDFTSNSGHNYTMWGPVGQIVVFGSFELENGLDFDGVGIVLQANASGKTLRTNGSILTYLDIYSEEADSEASWILQDDLLIEEEFYFDYGTFDANNHNITASSFNFSGGVDASPTIIMGSGVWEVTGDDSIISPWLIDQYQGVAENVSYNFIPGSSTIKFTNESANNKTFAFVRNFDSPESGKTYNNIWFAGVGTGEITIEGSNTFNDFKVDAGRIVKFVKGYTTTVNTLSVSGADGNLTVLNGNNNPFDGSILSAEVNNPGQNYLVDDEIYVNGGNTDAVLIVTGVDGGGAISSFNISNGGTAYSIADDQTTTTNGIGTGFIVDILDVSSSTQFNLSKSSGTVEIDYLNISNSNAVGGAEWYAGANSVNNTNNSGWIFTAAPISDTSPPSPNPPVITASNISQTSITWSLSSASDSGVGIHTMPYGFASISGGPYVFQTLTSLVESGLICNTSYTKYGVLRDMSGNQTGEGSVTVSTLPCTTSGGGSGIPIGWLNLPMTPVNGFKVSINSGANTTSSRIVNLSFNAGADVKKMAISLVGDFKDTGQEDYWPTKQIDLCSKYGGAVKNPTCPDGQYTVYVKFYTWYGVASDVFFSKINLITGSNTSANPKYSTYNFSAVTLKKGSRGEPVKELQRFLNAKLNFDLVVDGKFGPKTFTAVRKWQTDNRLVADGIVGPKTKESMKSLISGF